MKAELSATKDELTLAQSKIEKHKNIGLPNGSRSRSSAQFAQ